MPELPEVQTIVDELKPLINGKTVREISIRWPRTVDADPELFTETLLGHTFQRITRRGKYLCFYLETGHCLTVHLRMTGTFLFQPAEKDHTHIRVILGLDDGLTLYFKDVRKFGRMKLWPPGERLLPHLGPEPLEEETVFDVLRTLKSRRAIKTVLLDQTVLAGVGNIYADEALFQAGVHPLTPANGLTTRQARELSRRIPRILKQAIKNKGTTISDYRTTEGSEGGNRFFLDVYGRTGEPCRVCKTQVERMVINNRSAHYCILCQAPLRKSGGIRGK